MEDQRSPKPRGSIGQFRRAFNRCLTRQPGMAHPNLLGASLGSVSRREDRLRQQRGGQESRDQRCVPLVPWSEENPRYDLAIGFPSVLHSPLPLQSFLPLVVPQPPLPLQEFWPLQACLSFLTLVPFLPDSLLVVLSLSPPACAIA